MLVQQLYFHVIIITIAYQEHLWGAALLPEMGVSVDNLLVTVACPGGYCQCSPLDTSGVLICTHIFDAMEPDAQCHCNRTGRFLF